MLLPNSTALISAMIDGDAPSASKQSHAISHMAMDSKVANVVTEQALVLRAQAGDVQAFEQIYRSHAARIHGLCLRLLKDSALAEDCVQETFINAWRHLARFEARASLATWLHRIAVNAALSRTARQLNVFERDEENENVNAIDFGDIGKQLDLEQAMMQLPTGARHVLVLMGVYGHTHAETAEMLGIAIGTCKAQLHRARQLIAKQLNEA